MIIHDKSLKGSIVRFLLNDGTYKTFTVHGATLGGEVGGPDAWGKYTSVQREDVLHYDVLSSKGE